MGHRAPASACPVPSLTMPGLADERLPPGPPRLCFLGEDTRLRVAPEDRCRAEHTCCVWKHILPSQLCTDGVTRAWSRASPA